MQPIPDDILKQFDAVLAEKAIPGSLRDDYRKWLRYYLDFRMKYPPPDIKSDQVRINIDAGYRIDMIVEGLIIIENKTVEKLLPIHEAQLLTYLKMKDFKLGFLLNWNVVRMKDGIKRMVYHL